MKKILRAICALLTRLLFRTPFVILANIAYGISSFFDIVGNGLNDCQWLLKPLSDAPFIYDWKDQLKELDEKAKRRMLKSLNSEFDT